VKNPLHWLRRARPPLDLAAAEVLRDPFPVYAALRRAGPVHYLPHHDFWLVVGYDAVGEAFERRDIFSSAPYEDIDRVLLAADAPGHLPVRRLVSRHFSADALNRLTATAAGAAAALVAPSFDAVEGYGVPISRAVAADLIGFDAATIAEIVEAARQAATMAEGLDLLIRTLDAVADRAAIFRMLGEQSAGTLADGELRSLIRLLWLAATTTTERVIARSVLRLLQHADIRAAVAADRALVGPFIEEVMRLHPPEHMVPRRTVRPVDLAGTAIPTGADVRLCVGAANRDPTQFEDPDSLRLDRGSRLHFAFGAGIHRCLGAPLTRRVVAAAVDALLARAPDFSALEPLDSLDMFATPAALTPRRLLIGTAA
jgi:cytochrome P450